MNTIKQHIFESAKDSPISTRASADSKIREEIYDLIQQMVYSRYPYKNFSDTVEILNAFTNTIQNKIPGDHPQKRNFDDPKFMETLTNILLDPASEDKTQCEGSNDPEFLNIISGIIQGVADVHHPGNIVVIRINNWFGSKWLGFSGKMLGALGVWTRDLVIPPFVPNRVQSICTFQRLKENPQYQKSNFTPQVHTRQTSSDNFQRKLKRNQTYFWYSANSKQNRQGSLMAYVAGDDSHWPWYLGFEKSTEWKIKETKGISLHQVQTFQNTKSIETKTLNDISL